MIDIPRALSGAIAIAMASGAYARWRLGAPQLVWAVAAVSALLGAAASASWGVRPALAAALVVGGMVVSARGQAGTIARLLGLAAASVISPAVGLCGVVLLAWDPERSLLHWIGVALGLALFVALRFFSGEPVGPLLISVVLLVVSAGILVSRPLSAWVIGPGPRLASYVVLLTLPALVVLAFSWTAASSFLASEQVARALVFGALAAAVGAALALAGLGGLAIASSSEAKKGEIAGLVLVPLLLALPEGASVLALAVIPLGLAFATGSLVAIASRRGRSSQEQILR